MPDDAQIQVFLAEKSGDFMKFQAVAGDMEIKLGVATADLGGEGGGVGGETWEPEVDSQVESQARWDTPQDVQPPGTYQGGMVSSLFVTQHQQENGEGISQEQNAPSFQQEPVMLNQQMASSSQVDWQYGNPSPSPLPQQQQNLQSHYQHNLPQHRQQLQPISTPLPIPPQPIHQIPPAFSHAVVDFSDAKLLAMNLDFRSDDEGEAMFVPGTPSQNIVLDLMDQLW